MLHFLQQILLNFNTSHVNVNHIWHFVVQRSSDDFNTSHVNVNHLYRRMLSEKINISIHLMLMLIKKRHGHNPPLEAFQYISC